LTITNFDQVDHSLGNIGVPQGISLPIVSLKCFYGCADSKVLNKVAVIAFCTGVGEGTMSIALMVKHFLTFKSQLCPYWSTMYFSYVHFLNQLQKHFSFDSLSKDSV
jgi:hypothetical protein